MQIRDLNGADKAVYQQAAQMLVDCFRDHHPDAWPDLESGLETVHEALGADKICLGAFDDDGRLLGCIGGLPDYDGNVWELHPLAVRPDLQKQGIGRKLVAGLEEQVRRRGGLTIQLGTDDEDYSTTLGGIDLYDNLPEKIATIRNLRGHPYEFYQKCGYVITGVVPDANGIGKPDILMAKRVAT